SSEPPLLLSDTGLFIDLLTLEPTSGLIEYQINTAFWSDGADKRRWIGIPDSSTIQFNERSAWGFPLGTVIVKHFEIQLSVDDPNSTRRLETRILVNTTNGFRGYVYRWNDQQTDATLLTDGLDETLTITDPDAAEGMRTQRYHYPSRAECLNCHTGVAGEILGVKTLQINRDFSYPQQSDNQLRSWNHINLFDQQDIGNHENFAVMVDASDENANLTDRARAYLDANCSQCHQPNGTTQSNMDLRYFTALNDTNTLNTGTLTDTAESGIRLIVPGNKEQSELWLRMQGLSGERMPNIGSNLLDTSGIQLIGEWIDSL
ncbi:MAG: c-type cytochrome domain-containing protein, partial [Pseudomonadales bacterium]